MCNLAVLCCQMIGYKLWRRDDFSPEKKTWRKKRKRFLGMDTWHPTAPKGKFGKSSSSKVRTFWDGIYDICELLRWVFCLHFAWLKVNDGWCFFCNWEFGRDGNTKWKDELAILQSQLAPFGMTQFPKYLKFLFKLKNIYICQSETWVVSDLYPGCFFLMGCEFEM